MFSYLPVIIFGILGLLLCIFMLVVLINAIFPFFNLSKLSFSVVGMREKWLIKKSQESADILNECIVSENFNQALPYLRTALCLGHVSSSRDNLAVAKRINAEAMSNILILSKKMGGDLTPFVNFENLIEERARLLDLYFDSRSLMEKISAKRKEKGGDKAKLPDSKEFESQLKSLKDDLEQNKEDINTTLNQIVRSLNHTSKSDGYNLH